MVIMWHEGPSQNLMGCIECWPRGDEDHNICCRRDENQSVNVG
jgi:hypothetical protein